MHPPRGAGGDRQATAFAVIAAQAAAVYLLAFRAARDAPRASFVFATFAVAALLNALWLLRGRRLASLRRLPAREVRAALGIVAASITGNLCMARAVVTLGSGPAATLGQTQIFFVALVAWIALGERLRASLAAGCVLAGVGVVVVQLPQAAGGAWSAAGVAWALGAAACFGLIVVIGRKVAATVDVERINAARLLVAAPLILLVPGAAHNLGRLTAADWGWAALAAAAGPVASRLLQLHALVRLEAARLKLWMLTTPMWAFLLEAVCWRRLPGALDLAGAALVLAGVAIPVTAASRRRRRGQPA